MIIFFSSVSPLCTSSSQSGQTLYMDTSEVPDNVEVECYCDFKFTKTASTVHVYYSGADYKGCGIWFKFLDRNFACTIEGLYSIRSFEELTFYRASHSEATVCFIVYLGELVQLHIVLWHNIMY